MNISGEAGELLTFGGSGKTNGLPNLDGWGRAQALSSLVLELHYTDQSTEKKTIHFLSLIHIYPQSHTGLELWADFEVKIAADY